MTDRPVPDSASKWESLSNARMRADVFLLWGANGDFVISLCKILKTWDLVWDLGDEAGPVK